MVNKVSRGEKVMLGMLAVAGLAAAAYGIYKVVKPDPVVIRDVNNYTPGDYKTEDSLFAGMMAIFGQSQSK